jgi:hypothetical protein
MATTVKEFIAELSKIENQDQPIFSVWWVADDFEYGDDTATPTPEQFDEILNNNSFDSAELAEQVNDSVYYFMSRLNNEEEEEN